MARKVRSDIQVGNLEKKLQVAPGTIRNIDGSDARSDKKLGTLRKQAEKAISNKPKPASKRISNTSAIKKKTLSKSIVEIITPDQKKAARRTVKSHPKVSLNAIKKMSDAFRKSKA